MRPSTRDHGIFVSGYHCLRCDAYCIGFEIEDAGERAWVDWILAGPNTRIDCDVCGSVVPRGGWIQNRAYGESFVMA